ncbi:acyl-CoA dehydratase activase [Clostridium sp. MB40-C1]|uniref:acyl-CoA dehydratase activase n=1 Tax=Clostridium sp. MB40-C1 TaxID=3070996 RepID=UPI0027DECE24|nr:acyl-CoA dehydratase activase [Clostridium sp. MB40-C1]WMJ80560.1 acyl-CoA dehydratase activase [Clostridium sp. MB40-C1]
MIGYVCKYTPIEILESFGEEVMKIDPYITNFHNSDTLMHPNMCFYCKSVLEFCLKKQIKELILVNCCDSIKRLYDVLKFQGEFNFLHIIDIPQKNSCCSIELFKNEILKFINHYEHYSGKIFNEKEFKKIVNNKNNHVYTENSTSLKLALMGGRCKNSLIEYIEKLINGKVYNFTCTSNYGLYNKIYDNEDILTQYAKNILNYFPCLRMADIDKRYSILKENFSGIIYHTIKFCDFYSYEYSNFKNNLDVPMIKIETDYSEQSEGQIRTRIEAFVESLNKFSTSVEKNCSSSVNKVHKSKFALGIDSGSTSTNAVIIDENKSIVSFSIVKTSSKSSIGVEKALNEVLKKSGLCIEDLCYIVSTGYGRVSIPFADQTVTEITCHAKGANFLNSNIRTIIDIGGQDSKAIKIDGEGNVKDFAMNDKCAAGTGRFLEMMARTLEVSIDTMGSLSLKHKENIDITSMCSVFAESEVISLIAENKEKSDIIYGICNSIANRTLSLIDRIKREEGFMITGGVAKNIGVVQCLEKKLNNKIFIPKEPEIIGALGASLIALEKSS